MKDGACTIRLDLDLDPAAPGECTLAVFHAVDGHELIRLVQRRAGTDQALSDWDLVRQNYQHGAAVDGTTSVIEAVIAIALAPHCHAHLSRTCRVGTVIERAGRQRVTLRLRPGRMEFFLDGVLVDEDWPSGGLAGVLAPSSFVTAEAISDADLGVADASAGWSGSVLGHQIHLGHPPGRNRWAGDTMLFHDGVRLHLLYLIDRRHHASRGGCGGHQVAHISSSDLRTWHGHPLAMALEEPWQTCGTGSVVRHDGRWWLVHGLHSSRIVDDAGCGKAPLPQPFRSITGTPMGTTLAVSDDGVHFHQTRELVHAAQNPSVYPDPAGGFVMFAGYGAEGLYRSDDLRHWRVVDEFIIPFGAESPWRNSTECLCLLEWNGFHYLFGGRSGFWMARSLTGPWWDQDAPESREVVAAMRRQFGTGTQTTRPLDPVLTPRWDIYDGQWVPMACALPDGRRILAGWLEDIGGWAGCLVMRELLQESDGTLGLRWLDEMLPPHTQTCDEPAWEKDSVAIPEACLIEVTLFPGAGAFGILIGADEAGGAQLELLFDPVACTASWSLRHGDWKPYPRVPTPSEVRRYDRTNSSPHWPWKGGDFALEGVEGLDRPLALRLLIVQDAKSGSVVVDAEIGGRRTMITRRRGLAIRRVRRCGCTGPALRIRRRIEA